MAKKTGEERWKDLDITKDEVDRIGKALKNEEFRKMFLDYAQEISDPKNREIYEQEIAQMEAERGMDVQFIHPKPGKFILKLSAVHAMSTLTPWFMLHPYYMYENWIALLKLSKLKLVVSSGFRASK